MQLIKTLRLSNLTGIQNQINLNLYKKQILIRKYSSKNQERINLNTLVSQRE